MPIAKDTPKMFANAFPNGCIVAGKVKAGVGVGVGFPMGVGEAVGAVVGVGDGVGDGVGVAVASGVGSLGLTNTPASANQASLSSALP